METKEQITDIRSRKDRWNVQFNNYPERLSTSTELRVYQSGHKSSSTPGYLSEPAIYDHYVLHYIYSGEGQYYIGQQSYALRAGDFFLIPPYQKVQYQASKEAPWRYYWVGFMGLEARELLHLAGFEESLCLSFPDPEIPKLFAEMVSNPYGKRALDYALLGQLYQLLAKLINQSEQSPQIGNRYYSNALQYIQENFHNPSLSVAEIAKHLGLARSYLYKIFMKVGKISVNSMICNIRLSHALLLLKSPDKSMTEISYACGFTSQSYFSKLFKQHFGLSPVQYRASLRGEEQSK